MPLADVLQDLYGTDQPGKHVLDRAGPYGSHPTA